MMTSKFYEPAMDRFTVKLNAKPLESVMCYPIFAKSRGQLFSPEQISDGEECVATPVTKDDNAEMVALLYLNNKRAQYGSRFHGTPLSHFTSVLGMHVLNFVNRNQSLKMTNFQARIWPTYKWCWSVLAMPLSRVINTRLRRVKLRTLMGCSTS